MKLIRNSIGSLVAIVDSEDIVDIHNYSTDTNTTTLTIPAVINKDINFVNYGVVAWTLAPDLNEGLTLNKSTAGITVNAGKSVSLRYDTLAKNFIIAGSSESTGGGGSSDAEDIFLSIDFEADPLGGAVAPSNSVELAISKLQGQSNILSDEKSDKAENRVYNAVITLDKDFYTNYTQTGNITLSTTGTPLVGATAIFNITGSGNGAHTFSVVGMINVSGIAFDVNAINTIEIKYNGTFYEYTIARSYAIDVVAPTLVSANTNSQGNHIYLTFNKTIIGTPVFTVSGGKTISSQTIINLYTVDILLTTNYISSDVITVSGGGIQSTGGATMATLTNQAVSNIISVYQSEDDFNRTDTTDIAGTTTPIGSYTWVRESGVGTLGIVSNKLKLTSISTTDAVYTYNPGVRNGTKTVIIGATPLFAGQSGFFPLYIDGNNYILITTAYNIVVRSGGSSVTAWSSGLAANAWVAGDILTIVLTATTIQIQRNGVTLTTVTAGSGLSGTKIGVQIFQDVQTSFDLIRQF